MAVTTKIDPETGIREHTVTGPLDLRALITALKKVYSMPEFRSEMNVIWDLREADLSAFSSEDIRQVREYVGRHWGVEGTSRAALVVTSDLGYGLTRMYEILLESRTASEVHVFRDYDEALRWVRE
jgi:hypothetical protein